MKLGPETKLNGRNMTGSTSLSELRYKKVVLKNFEKFTRNPVFWSVFLVK